MRILPYSRTGASGTGTNGAGSVTRRNRGANFGYRSLSGTLRVTGWSRVLCGKQGGEWYEFGNVS